MYLHSQIFKTDNPVTSSGVRTESGRKMDAHEIQNLSALVEATSREGDSIGKLFDEAVRDPAVIFSHISECGIQSGLNCNCSIARMNFQELSALSDAAQSGLDGLGTQPSIHTKISEKENRVLFNIASFSGILTAKSTRADRGPGAVPKPMSALRMMTTGDEAGRSFWGPNGIITKSLASFRAAVAELRALVARQAAAILRLLNHLANLGGGAAPAAIAAGSAPRAAPAALARRYTLIPRKTTDRFSSILRGSGKPEEVPNG